MRTKFLVFAVLAFALVLTSCNFPAKKADIPAQPTIPATGFQGETSCVPVDESTTCVKLDFDELNVNNKQIVQAHADWVTDDEVLTGIPENIILMYTVLEENRLAEVSIQPNGEANLDEACKKTTDCTVYAIVVEGYACEYREGTAVFDCPKK
jgi:hypothetical protein